MLILYGIRQDKYLINPSCALYMHCKIGFTQIDSSLNVGKDPTRVLRFQSSPPTQS